MKKETGSTRINHVSPPTSAATGVELVGNKPKITVAGKYAEGGKSKEFAFKVEQRVEVPTGGIEFRRYWHGSEIRTMGEDCNSTIPHCVRTLTLKPEVAFIRNAVRRQEEEGKLPDGMWLRSVAEANHLEIAKAADARDWIRFVEGFKQGGFYRTVKQALYDFIHRKKPDLSIGTLKVYSSMYNSKQKKVNKS